MARGLIGHPLKDDIFMVRDDFGGPGAPMPYVMGGTGAQPSPSQTLFHHGFSEFRKMKAFRMM